MEVIVTTDNFVEGFDVIEVGSEIHDTFVNFNTVPYDPINKFLSVLSNEQERITQKVVDKAIHRVQNIARQNGWNAVLNFDLEFEEMGEWASINSVTVHAFGVLCYIEPICY